MLRTIVLACTSAALIGFCSSSSAPAATINIVPGPALEANAPALAAFNRAAMQWQQRLADPITIRIEADLFDLGAAVVNDTFVEVNFLSYKNEIRPALIADAADELNNGIVAFLPTGENDDPLEVFLPDGFTPTLTSQVPTANLKALGLVPSYPDDNPTEADGFIDINTFSSDVDFDFDNSDGVDSLHIDFETFVAREIGHVLGFYSDADFVDQVLGGEAEIGSGQVALTPMDLFRFQDEGGNVPTNEAEFNSFARSLHDSNQEVFSDAASAWRLSSGEFDGDGNRSDTWKDNALVGDPGDPPIGIMDPTVPLSFLDQTGVTEISDADLRVLDLIGYDLVPEPSSALLTMIAVCCLALRPVRARKK